jgi:predicted transcriptional regulator
MAITTGERHAKAKRSAMVRVSDTTHRALKELAERSGEPVQAVLEKAVEAFRRQRFFEELNAAYTALQSDSEAWQEELAERRAWEITLTDGLEDD